MKAEYADGETVFSNEDEILFSSENISKETAGWVCGALAAHYELMAVAKQLVEAVEKYKVYDSALSAENIKRIAARAEDAMSAASCELRMHYTITSRKR